jgi:hypothetical protein
MTLAPRLLLSALLVALALPSPAAAQKGSPRGTEMLSFWLVLDAGNPDGIGAGGRYMLPIADGVIRHHRIRDEFTLEFGADFVHYEDHVGAPPFEVDYSWNGFLPVVGATWNFWLTPKIAVYPKLDVGYWFGWYTGDSEAYGYDYYDFDGVFVQGAVGFVYRGKSAAFRAEAGSGLLRIGVGFPY